MKNLSRQVFINIWDDYPDDGFVAVGVIQKTSAYVEDDRYSDKDCRNILNYLLAHLKENYKLPEVSMSLKFGACWELKFENLTHEQRESLVEQLQQEQLQWNQIPISIYSES